MGNIINWGANVLTPELVRDIQQALYLETLEAPEITQFHTVITGIKAPQQVLYLGELEGDVGQKLDGDCTIPANTAKIATTSKTWNPVRIGNRFDECAENLLQTAAVYATKNKVQMYDLTATQWAEIFMQRLAKRMKSMYWRTAWFNDTAAANQNGSPAGDVTNGLNTAFVNSIDGYFSQMIDYVLLNSTTAKQLVTMTGNNQATYALQLSTLTPSAAYAVASAMKYNVPVEARNLNNGVVLCTQSFYDKLEQYFQGKDLESMYTNIIDGVPALRVNGMPFQAIPEWDKIIDRWFNTGTKWIFPHRAVYTSRDNLQIGTTSAISEIDTVNMWYEQKDRKVYIDVVEEIDAKVVLDNKFVLAI